VFDWLNHYEHCKTQRDSSYQNWSWKRKTPCNMTLQQSHRKKKIVSHKASDSSHVAQCSSAIQARNSLQFGTHQWSIVGPPLSLQICCPTQCWISTSHPYSIFLYVLFVFILTFLFYSSNWTFPKRLLHQKSVCSPRLTHPRHTPAQNKNPDTSQAYFRY